MMRPDMPTTATARGLRATNAGAAWEQQVVDLAHMHGWVVSSFRSVRVAPKGRRTYYATPVGADGAGWPDLVLVRDRVLFRELKTDKARLRPKQRAWARRLRDAGADVGVWRPRDLDVIVRELRERVA